MASPLVGLIPAAVLVGILATVVGVRWARRHARGAQFVAGGMMMILGMIAPMIAKPPEQGIEEAREDKGKKGAESGDPPNA
jgi:hypothetical protein